MGGLSTYCYLQIQVIWDDMLTVNPSVLSLVHRVVVNAYKSTLNLKPCYSWQQLEFKP